MASSLPFGASRLLGNLPARLSASMKPSIPTPRLAQPFSQPASLLSALRIRPFSSSPAPAAPPAKSSGAKPGAKSRAKRLAADRDPRLHNLDKALYKLKFVPPPLRMARNRYLRHWTIHRAWLLFRRQCREKRERELMQQYQSMQNACEELRRTAGPGKRDLGYLFRVAMEKKGVWRHGGIPIEYARPQTETPAREAWNHDWKP